MPAIETHPFEPFLPENARLLMLGTFPPASKRWCMPFYYPNFTNDMWRIFGIVFFQNKDHFVRRDEKRFDQPLIAAFLREKGIALFDTAYRVIRTTNTASDKDLDIVEKADIDGMLCCLPNLKAVCTAGQLATTVFARHIHSSEPATGEYVPFVFEGRELRHYRMPSSSRAYPMKVEKKADIYAPMFQDIIQST